MLARTLGRYIERDLVAEYNTFGDRSRVRIHPTARVHTAHFNTISGDIAVERNAFFGSNVTVVTGMHGYTQSGLGRNYSVPKSGRDIIIWVGVSATVLGPCEIGENAVVAAGAVVTRDVPPYTIVAGVPARAIRHLPDPREPDPEPSCDARYRGPPKPTN